MESFIELLLCIASDSVLFWVLQFSIISLFVVALVGNVAANLRAGKGGATLSVKRGNESMALFYGSYVAINGLLVALCLSVEIVKDYRVFWVILDSLVPAYVCLFNPWSRNKLLSWAFHLRNIETR